MNTKVFGFVMWVVTVGVTSEQSAASRINFAVTCVELARMSFLFVRNTDAYAQMLRSARCLPELVERKI
jgi:hypothetical protein